MPTRSAAPVVLVVDDDEMIRELVVAALGGAGLHVVEAEDGREALSVVADTPVDLVLSDIQMPHCDGFELLRTLREQDETRTLPVMLMTALSQPEHAVTGLRLGADDYVRKPFDLAELVARVEVRLHRPPATAGGFASTRRAGLLTERGLREELEREVVRSDVSRRGVAVATLLLPEVAAVAERFGRERGVELVRLVAETAHGLLGPLETVGLRAGSGGAGGGADDGATPTVTLVLPELVAGDLQSRLATLAADLALTPFTVGDDTFYVSPSLGWADSRDVGDAEPVPTLLTRSMTAALAAAGHRDLVPQRWEPGLDPAPSDGAAGRGRWRRLRLPTAATQLQVAMTFVIGVVLPFFAYLGLYGLGHDVSRFMYVVIVVSLAVTAASIWTEGLLAMRRPHPPRVDPVDSADPLAAGTGEVERPGVSAIIAAYLPNEAATVVDTVEHFLRTRYAGPVQVILAYNTPTPMPIEDRLNEIARRDERFVPFRVDGSTSKAQNVNAALAMVTGDVTGVFDADHHPDVDAFERATAWLTSGYDVVQGHCVVRNGDASLVARTVAVEFEAIYAVSHPGRARLHGFGIFGGSNGYWRTEALREARMQGRMLTEDIDSSVRALLAGRRIASDPDLLSRELAPTSVDALWHQRMRWAQGWFQVSRRHLAAGWRSDALSLRNKVGLTFLLGWREIYPWISVQMVPLIAFLIVREGGAGRLDWLIPLFVLTTLFTLSVGPGQVLFAHRLAAPEIRRRRAWFWSYLLVSSLVYTEFKNVIARVAQLKELAGERRWVVTPRSADVVEGDA